MWPNFFTTSLSQHHLFPKSVCNHDKLYLFQIETVLSIICTDTEKQHNNSVFPSVYPFICPVKQCFVSKWEANQTESLLMSPGLLMSASFLHLEQARTQRVSQWTVVSISLIVSLSVSFRTLSMKLYENISFVQTLTQFIRQSNLF